MLKMLRVLEMAQPAIPAGVKEDYVAAITACTRTIGNDIWDEELDITRSKSNS